jgi:hypothetical protein
LNEWVNDSIKDLYDQIINVNQEYFVSISSTISVVSGTAGYSLPSDFAHLLMAQVEYDGEWRLLHQFNIEEMGEPTQLELPTILQYRYRLVGDEIRFSPEPSTAMSVRLWYIPVPPTLTQETSTTNFVFVWDEYVILDCLEKHANKEESDPAPFMARKMQVLERILARAKQRNYGEPDTIRDSEREDYFMLFPWRVPS